MNGRSIQWPGGRRAAVSLTYDDGIVNHPQNVAPQLEAHGLRGTFYVPLQSGLMQNPLPWRAMGGRGHELGNHTVFHPCRNTGGRFSSWLDEERWLERYTEERWLDEIRTANQALRLVDGKNDRTFGNTCFDNWIGPDEAPVCLERLIQNEFVAARGEESKGPVNMAQLNLNNLGTVWADRRSFGDFAHELEEILDTGGWVIYTFHGVGQGSHNHFIEEKEHLLLLDFLRDNKDRIWTAPVIEVARHLKK